MSDIEITLEKWVCYQDIRESGLTNMMAVGNVVNMSMGDLTREDVHYIMKNYGDLEEKFKEHLHND